MRSWKLDDLMAVKALKFAETAGAIMKHGLAWMCVVGGLLVVGLTEGRPPAPGTGEPALWPALALGEHGRGDKRAAERWLARAEEWANGPGRAEGAGFALGGDWVDFQVLCREAKATLRGPKSNSGGR